MTCLPRNLTGVPVVWADLVYQPKPQVTIAPRDATLAEIVAVTPNLPPEFELLGVVYINDHEVFREYWHTVVPAFRPDITIQIGIRRRGGGRSEGKAQGAQIATIVALIALTIAAPQLGVPAWAVHLSAIAISVGGALAARALSPPPSLDPQTEVTPLAGLGEGGPNNTASLSGNVLAPGGSLPRVLGTHRVFPPLVTRPYRYNVGTDVYIEGLFALDGATRIADPQFGESFIDGMDDVEIEVIEGKPGDGSIQSITRQTFTDDVSIELKRHRVDPVNQSQLADQAHADLCVPEWAMATPRSAPHHTCFVLSFPEGLSDTQAWGSNYAVPIRGRMRVKGTQAWINWPEFHISSRNGATFTKSVVVKREKAPLVSPLAPSYEGPYVAYTTVPGQTLFPAAAGWEAAPYFSGGSGGTRYEAATFDTHFVRNFILTQDGVEVYLDPDVFAAETYEFQFIAGAFYHVGTFTTSNYTYGGSVWDFFGFRISGVTAVIAHSRANVRDKIVIASVSSIWNEPPVNTDGICLIAVRAKNRNLERFSVLASGLIPVWTGSEFSGHEPSSNPAENYRNVLLGNLNADALPRDLVDDPELLEWRQHCIDNDYTVDAVIENRQVMDVLSLIASCGYARPRQSENWGVIIDRDRSGESALQPITPLNSRGLAWEMAFARQPAGFRVRFSDSADSFREREIIVLRPGAVDDGRYEDMRYDGLVTEDQARARALFDLEQLDARKIFYRLTMSLEHLRAPRGSLVRVTHDALQKVAGYARIAEVIVNASGMVTGLRLNATIPAAAQAWSNMDEAWSNHEIAWRTQRYGLSISRFDGTTSTHEIVAPAEDTRTITFVTPFADPGRDSIDRDSIVATGLYLQESKRMIVFDVTPKGSTEASLTLVDEAPELWQ